MRIGESISTYTGVNFYPLDPREEEISTTDIAHALSLLCRGNGHLEYFYSVGQHSLNCAYEAKARGYSTRVQFACLLHDASEAYLSDITRPVKKELTTYKEIEAHLQSFIYTTYGLTDLTSEELAYVDEIDDDLLVYELNMLIKDRHDPLPDLVSEVNIQFADMREIEQTFTNLVQELSTQILQRAAAKSN